MDLYPRVIEMRQRTLHWLSTMQIPEESFGVHADSSFQKTSRLRGMFLPGTYNATNCLFLLGAYEKLTPTQVEAIAAYLNRFQREDGAYRIPEMMLQDIYYPDFEYIDLHTTNYTLGALALLGQSPLRPLDFLGRYNTPEKLAAWLYKRNLTEPWAEGNSIVNISSFFAYLLEAGEERYRRLLQQLLDWHQVNQDPASGYWYDPTTRDLTSAMAGATHNLHLYYYLNQPVPRFEKIIDHCLGILEGISSACLDVDVVDILTNLYVYGYRQGEIEAYLERKLTALLDFQNPDGGFPDLHEGIRLFDGWEKYQEPQGLSNCFATWFRWIAIGMICRTLYPTPSEAWHFRNTLGIGYFKPRLPAAQATIRLSSEETLTDSTSRLSTFIPDRQSCFGADAGKILSRIRERLSVIEPARLLTAEGIYQVDISGAEGGSLNIKIFEGKAYIEPGEISEARVCLIISADTLGKLLDGKLNTTIAYMTKKLKIRGDITLAMKLDALLK